MRIPALLAVLSLSAAPVWAQSPAPDTPSPAPATAVPAPAPAPAPAPKMDLPTFLKQPQHRDAIVDAARNQIKQAVPSCATAHYQPTGKATVLEPARFSDGKPFSGAWIERIEASGCGPVHTLNVLSIAHPNNTLQIVGMMPGDTHTDPMMQKNALQYAQAIAVRAAPPGCKQLAFIDTKFDGFSGLPNPEVTDGRENRPWREIWTMSVCGSLYDVSLTFTPNAKGTALSGENPVKHSG